MAKKEAAPEAEEGEKPEGEGAEAAPKKGLLGKLLSKKMLMIAVPALLLVVGGGGAGAYFFLFKKSEDAGGQGRRSAADPAQGRVQRHAGHPGQHPEQ